MDSQAKFFDFDFGSAGLFQFQPVHAASPGRLRPLCRPKFASRRAEPCNLAAWIGFTPTMNNIPLNLGFIGTVAIPVAIVTGLRSVGGARYRSLVAAQCHRRGR